MVLGPVIRHRVVANVAGISNIPKHGGILAFGSHTSEAESLIIPAWLDRWLIHFFAKDEYWHKGALMRWFMNATGQIPVDRSNSRSHPEIDIGADFLAHGEKIAIYPEGTRSKDGKLHAGHTGMGHMAVRAVRMMRKLDPTCDLSNVVIVPVGMIGMEQASGPSGSGFFPKRAAVVINVGKPIRLTDAEVERIMAGRSSDGAIARRLTDDVMASIAVLCGKEFDPTFLPIPQD